MVPILKSTEVVRFTADDDTFAAVLNIDTIFGLRPTLRVVQAVTLTGGPNDPVAYAIAGKQLYASRYFDRA